MRTVDMERMARINTALEEIAANMAKDTEEIVGSGDHIALVRHFRDVREAAELVKAAREAMYKIEDVISRERIPEVFRSKGIKTINIENVGRVTISARWACSMIDPEKGMDWLRSHELGGIIKETVNAQTLAATAKNLVESEGKELPEDIFKTSINTYTSITKK